jgi:hypothetical protein
MYPSHQEPSNTWAKVSQKRGRPTHEDEKVQREATQIKKSEYWLRTTASSDRCTALLEEDND